jgi:hypothetical protein
LVIVKPETVVRWHRKRFASYWTRLSRRSRPGRPGKDREIRELIRRIANANILWGAPVDAETEETTFADLEGIPGQPYR